jgi:crotonobetainyl-CoA:carnitine CoA-transferase CaiB-like acyl-CoA transferase
VTPLLSGIRIVDLTSVIMGPFATAQLGALGADVIKVEPPSGEAVRHVGPMKSPLMGAMFLNANRNKRSVCLDLKSPEAQRALRRIVATADVVVHNMRRNAARRIGVDAETLQTVNPRLVHCTAIGFGRGGAYADDAAYDDVVQALSGFAAVNANANGEPRYIPQIAVDKISGLFVVQGVLAALLHRERTGEARAFEVTMLECAAHFLMTEHLQGQIYDPPIGPPGYARLMNPYRRPYPTKDGFVAVLPYIDKHWEKILPIIGREDVLKEDWFRTVTTRSANVRDLYRMVDQVMPTRTTDEWLRLFRDADIPCGPVNTLETLFEDPHLAGSGFFVRQDHPTEGPLRVTRHPIDFGPAEPDRPAPVNGQHTREILREAGLGEAEIDALAASGAAGAAS